MPFSFNPGQSGQVANPSGGEAPPLIVPDAPVITTTAPVEVISPFAYKNRNKSKFGVYFQVAIFFITGIMVVISGVFFVYRKILMVQVENKKQALQLKSASLPKLDVPEMQKLSSRLKLVNKIINERASVNTALKIWEATVLDDSVVYGPFSLGKNKSGKGFDLSFSGQTGSYRALYQQIAVLNDKRFSNYFSKMSISGLGPLDKKGVAAFKVSTVIGIEGIDPETVSIESPDSLKEKGEVAANATSTTDLNNSNSQQIKDLNTTP